MYANGFVVAIKNDSGQVLRESSDQEVFLPFGSEYTILLKNKNDRKAVAEIQIDGTNALGDRRIIIPAYGEAKVERFCIDGDLSAGRKLKFVSAESGEVQDPTSGENGIVQVKFWLEKPQPQGNMYYSTILRSGDSPMQFGSDGSRGFAKGVNLRASDASSVSFSSACEQICMPDSDVGATVEGRHSGQVFSEGHTGPLEFHSTTITLRMKGSKTPVTVQSSRTSYCTNCRGTVKRSDNFCGKCGKQV